MSKQTKMNGADSPVMEFNIPEGEVDKEVSVGEIGTMVIPVVVIARNDGMITLRKAGQVKSEGNFRPETLDEMRKRIIDEQEEATETAAEAATEDESKE